MWSPTLLPLLFAASVYAQTTVTVCESYSVTNVITFTEYTTYYQTNGDIIGSRPTTTIATSARPSTSLMSSSTSRTMSSAQNSALSSITSSALGDPIIASTTSMSCITSSSSMSSSSSTGSGLSSTSSSASIASSTTNSATTTIQSTSPSATESSFYVVFNPPTPRKLAKRALLYLAFDADGLSIVVSDQLLAALFTLDSNGNIKSAGLFVTIDEDVTPPQFALAVQAPNPPLRIGINFGVVTIQGVDAYCLEPDNDLVLVTDSDDSASATCSELQPQLVAAQGTGSSSNSDSSSLVTATPSATSTEQMTSMSTTEDISASSTTASTSTSLSEGSITTTAVAMTTTADPVTTSSSTSTTSQSTVAVVTNKAYIDTILRHHNVHRANHTVPALTWDTSLAETARKIADTCVYEHNTTIDCPSNADGNGYSCYGQNIGAGYLATQMGAIITGGFYNSEVSAYTYYNTEPSYDTVSATLHEWGHFSQVVWESTRSVGCYTQDCTDRDGQLGNIDSATTRIAPIFTVCNYGPPGNYLGEFEDNVLQPLGQPTVQADYQCLDEFNCESS